MHRGGGKVLIGEVSMVRHSNIYGVKAEDSDGQEVPVQKWVDVNNGNLGIALLNKTKYGHSFHNGELRITLMRAAGDPDIYPNLGKFSISYSLFPHQGSWQSGVWTEGEDFNVPVYAAEPPSLALAKKHATRPEEDSFISIDSPGVILSGIKQSETGNELIVRLAEIEGRSGTVTLKLPVNINTARRLDLVEMTLVSADKPISAGRSVKVKINPHEIITLGIIPAL